MTTKPSNNPPSRTPLTDQLSDECYAMPLRTRGIDHAIRAHRKLELENIHLREDAQKMFRDLGNPENQDVP